MLKNAALIVKIGFDTAENEPQKECCVVARSQASGPVSHGFDGGQDLPALQPDLPIFSPPADRSQKSTF